MLSRRIFFALAGVCVLFAVVGLAGSRLPIGKTVFLADDQQVWRLEYEPLTGWPTTLPVFRAAQGRVASMAVGPDSMLYIVITASAPTPSRIVRCNKYGDDLTVIMENSEVWPFDLAFDKDGNLLFTTCAKRQRKDQPSMGVWAIPRAEPGSPPIPVIPSDDFEIISKEYAQCTLNLPPHLCFLPVQSGENTTQDLLVTLTKHAIVARTTGPRYFDEITPFIDEDPYTKDVRLCGNFRSPGLAVLNRSSLLVVDWSDGKLFKYGLDGEYLGVFAEAEHPNRIATDSDGFVYLVCQAYRKAGSGYVGTLSILQSDGTLFYHQRFAQSIFAVAVMEHQ